MAASTDPTAGKVSRFSARFLEVSNKVLWFPTTRERGIRWCTRFLAVGVFGDDEVLVEVSSEISDSNGAARLRWERKRG